jgi:BolA protein
MAVSKNRRSDMSVQANIVNKLRSHFDTVELQVENESHMHSVPANSETHFKVLLVTDDFVGKRQVARHQSIYTLLSAELEGPVHALALHTYSVQEWQGRVPESPNCMGGGN